MANLLLGRLGIALQHLVRGHDHAGGTEAALQAVLLPEPLLDRVQVAVLGEALDRGDLDAVALHGEEVAGLHGLAVHEDGAGAALAGVAPDVGAGEPDQLANIVDEQESRLHFVAVRLAVDGHLHWEFHDSSSKDS